MSKHSKKTNFALLPPIAQRRLRNISIGWALVALLEAVTYTILAFSIINEWSPISITLAALVSIIVTVLVTRMGFLTGVRLAGDLYHGLGSALAKAKLSWFNQDNRAKITKMVGQNIPQFMSIPAHQLQTFIHAPCLPIFIVLGIGLISSIATAMSALSFLVLAFVIQVYCQYLLSKTDAKRNEAESATNQATLEFVEHLELLRTSQGMSHSVSRLEKQWDHQEYEYTKINRTASIATCVSVLISVLPIVSLAIYLMNTYFIDAPLLFILLLLTSRAAAPLEQLAVAALGINDLKQLIKDYAELRSQPSLSSSDEQNISLNTSENYNFRVENVIHPSISNNLNLTIPYGSKLQVKGSSGSGKSTFLELLMRFDDPKEGKIYFNGIPLNQLEYDKFIENVAYAPQDPTIFTGSIADNIRMGKNNATDTEVEDVARKMALGDVLDRSSEGIYQPVGRQGSALSGGERQRVSLARALIKNSPIYILDEATSALDNDTESAIVAELNKLDSTVIFVSHKNTGAWHETQSLQI